MTGEGPSRRAQRRIDAEAKAAFVEALRKGARREDAAEALGFSVTGFYGARRRDPAFAAAWTEALAQPPAAERRTLAYAERGEVRIASANRRILQRRRRRHVRFDAGRQQVFLTHFASNCDTRAAAAAAGVSHSTVHYHCRTDSAFATAYAAALQEGYAHLEAEILRQRLEAQARLRSAIDSAGPAARLLAEQAAEFDRVMKVLDRLDRKPRRVERSFRDGGRRRRWTFDEAIAFLDRKLRALGARTGGSGREGD
jgi:hypothetical protein